MASMAQWDPDDTVQRLALEAARIAHEGLGSTQFEQLRITFSQQIEQENTDPEEQLRATVRLLLQKTNRDSGPKDVADTQIAGMCLIWLATTRVAGWSLLQLYGWGAALP
ncbi:MAG: hypothetical protein E6J34_00795 [Chloroflexi bacterium]|nr:MAG: hypothetical protein E6J34_00795 [Chloroflexota bacterium]